MYCAKSSPQSWLLCVPRKSRGRNSTTATIIAAPGLDKMRLIVSVNDAFMLSFFCRFKVKHYLAFALQALRIPISVQIHTFAKKLIK